MSFAIRIVAAAPVRHEPSHRAEMTTQLLFGETVRILEAQGEWFRIACTFDGYEGWVTYHLITPVDEQTATRPARFISTALLNPVQAAGELFQIPIGASLNNFNEGTRLLWDRQYRYEGLYRDVTEPPTKALFQNTIRFFKNAPYLWGGKTFMGVDCSGFVQTVFKVLGVPLLRDAYQQATQGESVSGPETAAEGDVAFFENESGKIIHVGLVLAGKKIIHASGTVRIDSLTETGIFNENANKETHRLTVIKRMLGFFGIIKANRFI